MALNLAGSGGRPSIGLDTGVRETPLLVALAALLTLTMLGPVMTISDASSTNVLGSLSGEGSSLRQGLYLLVAAVVAYGVRPLARPIRLAAVPWPLLFALGYCWLTISWSVAPGIGARRLLLTTLLIWSIFVAALPIGYERTLFLLRAVLVGALVGNFLTVVLVPNFGIHQANDVLDKNLIGEWRGFMMQKNITSAATAVTVLVFLFDAKRVPIAFRIAVLALAGLVLAMTGSRTSEGMCVAAAAIGFVYMLYRGRFRGLFLGAVMLGMLLLSVAPNFIRIDRAPDLRDPRTLSGRLDVWDVVLRYSADHQLLGAGYGSFWDVGNASPVYQYGTGWVTRLAQGHDGYLDLLATIGLPGLIIVIMAAIGLPLIRLFKSRASAGGRGALVLSTLMFCVGQNATESTLFDRDAISQVVLMTMLALLVMISPDAGGVLPFGVFGGGPRRPVRRAVPA